MRTTCLAVQPKDFHGHHGFDHDLEVYLNLASRMQLTGINQLWVADITYIRLQREFVYLAVILDAFSRKVVGWALDRTLASRLTDVRPSRRRSHTAAVAGVGASFGSRGAVCRGRLRAALAATPHDPEHESAGEPLRQRELRKLHEDAKTRGNLRERLSRYGTSRGNIEEFIDRYYNQCGSIPRLATAAGRVRTGRQRRDDFARRDHEFFKASGNLSIRCRIYIEGEAGGNRLPSTIVSMSFRLAIPWRDCGRDDHR